MQTEGGVCDRHAADRLDHRFAADKVGRRMGWITDLHRSQLGEGDSRICPGAHAPLVPPRPLRPRQSMPMARSRRVVAMTLMTLLADGGAGAA